MSLGFVFPGQGAQTVGMLEDLRAEHTTIKDRFEEASEIIGAPLATYVTEGPEATLNLTEFTQPAVLTASVALREIWQSQAGPQPVIVSGHSLGEYSALVAAGVLQFADAVKLVHLRGQYMQAAVPEGEGAIAAILGLENAAVEQICADVQAQLSSVVTPANYNAPGQVAIAGAKAAVEKAIDVCKEGGAKRAVLLPLSVPVHCPLMSPAEEQLKAALDSVDMQAPSMPVVQNADASIAENLEGLKAKLLTQLAKPVLWTQCVQTMVEGGVDQLVECGPGKVLSGLIKRIDRKLPVAAIGSLSGMQDSLTNLT